MQDNISDQKPYIAKVISRFSWPVLILVCLFNIISLFNVATDRLYPIVPASIVLTFSLLMVPLYLKEKYVAAVDLMIAGLTTAIVGGMLVNGGVFAPVYFFSLAVVILVQFFHGLRFAMIFTGIITLFAAYLTVFNPEMVRVTNYPPSVMIVSNFLMMVCTIGFSYIPFKLMRKALVETEESRERFQTLHSSLQHLIDMMPAIIIGIDREKRIHHWNSQAEYTTGIDGKTAVGAEIDRLLPFYNQIEKEVEEVFQTDKPAQNQNLIIVQNDVQTVYDLLVYPMDKTVAVVKLEDVSQKVRMQEMMMLTEKMMSVGGLAAGIAHEINNPLGTITQSIHTTKQRLSPGLDASRRLAEEKGLNYDALLEFLTERKLFVYLENISEASERASQIVQSMLNFSATSTSYDDVYDISDVIDDAVLLTKSDQELKTKFNFNNINLKITCEEGLPKVRLHRNEIIQVLINLIKNAAQAEALVDLSGYKPEIAIDCRKDNGFVNIVVTDNGPGIEQHNLTRIFEPFYTTKEPGTGTGLGLSVSYFIIADKHKGRLFVTSELGSGAEFTIQLPVVGNGGAN